MTPKVLLVPPADTLVEEGDEVLVLASERDLVIGARNNRYDDSLLPKSKLEAKVPFAYAHHSHLRLGHA